MKKIFTLTALVLITHVMAWGQVNLTCSPGGTVTVIYSGANGSCVSTAPTRGNIRYAIGTNCNTATNDPIATQSACGCCPVFTSDCIRYTNTVTSATSDQFVIGGITYNVTMLAIVPVRLTNVKAYEKNAAVQVEWTIQQENNIERYELERSQDGERFMKIGALPSKGNSNIMRNYALPDQNPITGINFYRIKTVGLSGEIIYSPVIKVNRNAAFTGLSVSPNPLSGNLVTLHYNLPKGNYMINIIGSSGQQVFAKKIQHSGGNAAETITFSNGLASGLYRLKLAGEGIVIQKKIIK